MLSNSRFVIRILLVTLVSTGTWVALTASAAIESREYKRLNGTASRADGLAAWQQIYSVMVSPRCINCHTATNYPQQGDDRHRHFANVIRGREGRGVPALSCIGCHQGVNAESTGVPGGPDWHLAPLSMRWQDANDRPLSSAATPTAISI